MNQPDLPEEKILKLLVCLFKQFEAKHGTQTGKLSSYIFYLTDIMRGCAKSSGLIYSKQVQARDGEIVQMGASQLVEAVNELEHRGYVQFDSGSKLMYTLTTSGYEKAKELNAPQLNFFTSLCRHSKNPEKIADAMLKSGIPAGITIIVAGLTWLATKLFS